MGRALVRAGVLGGTLVVSGGMGLVATRAEAQISPGKLSRGHASLEGSSQCLKCHDAAEGLAPAKCFACHKALEARIGAGKGLHARPEFRDCKTCHVEHQGLDYDLVWWGKAGRDAFDHRQAGYTLEGKHASLACEKCHDPAHLLDKQALAAGGVRVERTFLSLGTACAACHADAHHGQFPGRECRSCHSQTAWRPAPGFDHGKTSYPLTGKHAAVSCDACHKNVAADPAVPGAVYRRYAGVAGRDCASCHEDVHGGRLGTSCATCHSTLGWKQYETARFDHDRTAYPLRGRHAAVACEKCHAPGRPLRTKHERCVDCHADAHLGQLAGRADRGRCEACHDVAGFVPSRFKVEDHQQTAYPLAGAHLAVACNACHRAVAPDTLRRIPGVVGGGPARTVQLHFISTRCAECHRDPHRGEADRYAGKEGCEACHRVESWRRTTFDHAKTRFALTGGHVRAVCGACHTKADAGTPRERVRFTGLPVACETCHKDPHRGQLTRAGVASPCERCHTTETWKASRFDHSRDAAYRLDGAHARVACAACHRVDTENGVSAVRYKPLPTSCKECHGATGSPPKGGRP